MTTQEIIDLFNETHYRGMDRWLFLENNTHPFRGLSGDEFVQLKPDKALREAEAIRRKRREIDLDAVMPLLEQIASRINSRFIGRTDPPGREHRVGSWLTGLGFSSDIPTTFDDVEAVVEAWKARRG